MSQNPDPRPEKESGTDRLANLLTLEIAFLAFVAVVVIIAFLEALSYKLVSSRTPFVIMVPLLILIGVHAVRLYRVSDRSKFRDRLSLALTGRIERFSKVVSMALYMAVLLAVIAVFGHFAGIFVFGMFLMRGQAKEHLGLSLAVVGGTTLALYLLFEVGFNVELYRGILWRWYMGYRVF